MVVKLSRQQNIPKGVALRVDIVLGASENIANHSGPSPIDISANCAALEAEL
jgi:hypothetical protein